MKFQSLIFATFAVSTAAMRGGRRSSSSRSSSDDIPTIKIKTFASGAQEVPPVESDTSAELTLKFQADFSAAEFDLDVFDGIGITQAHLHCNSAGANGPIITFLLPLNANGMDIDGEAAT
ncbi:MAG: hypothetical protein SGARI_007076, partial [Bacillariaceae sp.]